MKYLILVLTIGVFAFNSSAQTKAKPTTKKAQQIKKPDSTKSTKKTKSNSPAKPQSTEIRKRPGKVTLAPKKKD